MRNTFTRLAPLALLAAACSCAAPDGEPPVEQADPEALTWIAPRPDATAATGDAFELSVFTKNPTGTVVHFAIDGREVGSCDATHIDDDASESDCFEDGFYRYTVRVTEAGSHTATAWFTNGTDRVEATRSFDVTTARDADETPRPALALDNSDLLDAGVAGAGEIDAIVSRDRAAALSWKHRGDFSYAASNGRIVVRENDSANAVVEVGSADEVDACMQEIGIAIEAAAQTHHVDAAVLTALAMSRTECATDEPGGPMRIPYARCAVLAHMSVAECDTRLRSDPSFAVELAARDLAATHSLHQYDPVVAGVVFVTGGYRASSSNRWEMAAPEEFVDEYVRAYNAVRSWRSDAPEAPACPAGTECTISALRIRAHNPCMGHHDNARHVMPGVAFTGTAADEIIIGTNGDDIIDGGGGHDIICGRGGDDHITGGNDADYIDGGGGRDTINGLGGDDQIFGRNGGDTIHGGPGADVIVAGVLDDDLYGDEGNDILIGGHGIDFISGGGDNDWMRGDTGWDTFVGGDGNDTVSFATTMPPGDALAGGAATVDGIAVSASAHLAANDRHVQTLQDHGLTITAITSAPLASGDGVDEPVMGIENFVGSPYNDRFDYPGVNVIPTSGNDTCNGAPCAGAIARPMGPFVYLENTDHDNGLIVMGSQGVHDDTFHISATHPTATTSIFHVTMPAGSHPTAGRGCRVAAGNPDVVDCDPNANTVLFIAGYGDDGSDHFTVGDGIPPYVEIHLNGGNGDDWLRGGRNDDVLFSGYTGEDHLYGRGGDDALLSESTPADRHQTDFNAYHGGRDFLFAGPGDDQLVSDYPCGNHEFHGGPGRGDIAGFRRSDGGADGGIRGQFGGPVSGSQRKPFHGRAFVPDRCGYTSGTRLFAGLEIFETSTGDDEVYGDDRNNTFWTWDGDDVIYGYGGNDTILGMIGDDQMYGGNGNDFLSGQAGTDRYEGGEGFDRINAQHDAMDRDSVIDCGPGGGTIVSSDSVDPQGQMCM